MAVTESHSVGGDNPGQYERPDSHPSGSSQASDSFCPGSGLTSGGQIGNSKNNYNSLPGGVLCQWSQSDARAVQRPLGVLCIASLDETAQSSEKTIIAKNVFDS